MIRATFLLLATGLVLGYATLRYGGVLPSDWNPCVLALGAAMVIGYLPIGRNGVSAPVDRLLYYSLLVIPVWALLQTIPLPAFWIAFLSPARLALATPLQRFGQIPGWLPLSIRPEATAQYALRYLGFGAVFLVTRDLMWRMPERQWLIALPPLSIAILETVVAVLQDASGVPNISVSGTFVNRDHFSAMLEMCLPFAAGAVFNFAPHGRRALMACGGAAATVAFMTGITLSVSRSGFSIALFSLLLLACVYSATRMRGSARVLSVVGSLVAVAGVGLALASGRLLDRMATSPVGSAEAVSLGSRLLFWKETLHVIATYTVTGCGFGGFVSAVAPFRTASVMKTLDYAHNDYLQFLAEGGLVALVPAVIVGLVLVRAIWRGVILRPSARHSGFAISCTVALLAGMLHSGVDLITYVPATGMLLCWIAGMVAGLDFDRARQSVVQSVYQPAQRFTGRR